MCKRLYALYYIAAFFIYPVPVYNGMACFKYRSIHVVQTTTCADVDKKTASRGIIVGCYDTKDGYRLSGCGEGVDSDCSSRLSQLLDRLGLWNTEYPV